MFAIEQVLIDLLLNIFTREEINAFLHNPRNTATILGALIAVSGSLLGTFLLLRKMSLTSDAISHTVLLGIVVAFLVMTGLLGMDADLSSPWLIIGATAAGVVTVILTELIHRSGLVREDAALGLAFPLLFAIAIVLIARFAENIHLDADAVMVGEIGIAWANTNSHCYENCDDVIITPDDPRAEVRRQCTNCRTLGITPRDARAEFSESCANCGTYTPGQAWQAGLIQEQPVQVLWPKAITVMGIMTALTVVFILLFYKELKLTTFDSALAATLGFRPGLVNYLLMIMVSLVAVGAFDAVGSILVIAFFIIPPAAAYLLTDRLSLMLIIGPIIGAAGAYTGYDLARGSFLGVLQVSDLLALLNRAFGLNLNTIWDSSISASMVMMIFFFFVFTWAFSPRYGLLSTMIRRRDQRRRFADQVVLGHIYNHQNTPQAAAELAVDTLYQHFRWSPARMQFVIGRLRAFNFIQVRDNHVILTERGQQQLERFRRENLIVHTA